ncbi:MAG TPA: DNA polymerase, partial [bacterium]|nr:DNA polymerase [bacterium]
IDMLRPLLQDEGVGKTGHNLKFDSLMLRKAGAIVRGIDGDTMIAAYLLDPSSRRYALKPLASEILGAGLKTYEDMVGKGKDQKKFSQVKIADAVDYACADVDVVLKIEPELTGKLEADGLTRVYKEIEIPLIEVLTQMEWNGIKVDNVALKMTSDKFIVEENRIRDTLKDVTGADINMNSPKQVADLLFNKIGLRKVRKDSTDIMVLEELEDEHPAVPLIIRYRHLNKLRGTYLDALPALINPSTGRIHTSYNQTLTATGRLSSSDPNLQNIPIRTADGSEIRRAFIPGSDDELLLSADYSQIEVRLLAELSGDPILLEAFEKGEDIHTRTAAEVFEAPISEVTPDQRRYAKTINFGLIYGMREFKLSQQLGITRKEAAEFIENYFKRYPNVKNFIEMTKEKVLKDGFTTTLFGRRRKIDELLSNNKMQRESGLRAAFNTRIQGTAADIMKIAMLKVHGMIEKGEMKAKLLLQVHDELVFEVKKSDVEETAAKVKKVMTGAANDWFPMKVTLDVDAKAGPNWLDMEKV